MIDPAGWFTEIYPRHGSAFSLRIKARLHEEQTSFQKIEKMKAPTPADLAVGVYESLVNTTCGLFLAIVFLTAYFFMKNRVTKLSLNANLMAVEMLKNTGLYEKIAH